MDPPFYRKKNYLITKILCIHSKIRGLRLRITKNFVCKIRRMQKSAKKIVAVFSVHCDKIANHHIRLILDNIFGADMFQSEIIWNYKRWSNSKKDIEQSSKHLLLFKVKRF